MRIQQVSLTGILFVLFPMALAVLTGCATSRNTASSAAPGSPAELGTAIERILADSSFINANWTVLARNLETNEILYSMNAGKGFVPASNGKIYTAAASLDLLGPEFTYRTRMYIDGPITDGVLHGNVIVRGSGDPVIGGRFNDGDMTATFRSWADSLKALGITRIDGDIIGDDDLFDDVPLGVAWSWDDEPFWYSAEISALSFNDNNVDFSFSGARPNEASVITWEPLQTDYISVSNALSTVAADSSGNSDYERRRGTNQFKISGQIPAGRTTRTSLSILNPTLFFVHVLRRSLVNADIAVDGRSVDADILPAPIDYSDPSVIPVASHVSPPLKDIVRVLNKVSHNLYAEMLLKTLGAEMPVPDQSLVPGSTEMGIARAMDTFASAGADTSRLHLKDGSGLSRMNYVTAEMTASVLNYMWNHQDDSTRAAFMRSLPIGGIDGTLESRFQTQATKTRVLAKTGSMTGVSSLAGFVPSSRGTPILFVLMCNQFTVPQSTVRRAQDQIVELLATYRK